MRRYLKYRVNRFKKTGKLIKQIDNVIFYLQKRYNIVIYEYEIGYNGTDFLDEKFTLLLKYDI